MMSHRGGMGGGPPGGGSEFGSLSKALGDYDQHTRHRKYMIEELEAVIENLQTELQEWKEKNKTTEEQCERLQLAAVAAEAYYDKKTQEKAMMERDLRDLSKQMEETQAQMGRKKVAYEKMKLTRQEKVAYAQKKYEEYKNEYMKNPVIAKYVEYLRKTEEAQVDLEAKKEELVNRQQKLEGLKQKHKDEWNAFKKKCVALAEMHAEIRKKMIKRNAFLSERNSTISRASLIGITASRQAFPSLSQSMARGGSVLSQHSFGAKIGAVVVPQRKSSTFQHLDELLAKSNERRSRPAALMDSGNIMKALCGSGGESGSGTGLLSQIRARLNVSPSKQPQDAMDTSEPPVIPGVAVVEARAQVPMVELEVEDRILEKEKTNHAPEPATPPAPIPDKRSDDAVFRRPATPPPLPSVPAPQPTCQPNTMSSEKNPSNDKLANAMDVITAPLTREFLPPTQSQESTSSSQGTAPFIPSASPPGGESFSFFGNFGASQQAGTSSAASEDGFDFFGGLFGNSSSSGTTSSPPAFGGFF